MFNRIRQRFRDMKTIKALCLEAEKVGNADGQTAPGAEHFVLSALALPDGTARKAFQRLHADPDCFRAAIAKQYESALQNVGITFPHADAMHDQTPVSTSGGLYQVRPSAQALMQRLTREIMKQEHQANATAPLLGAHVLLAALAAQYGVTARACQAMNIEPEKLKEAAKAEILAYRT